MKIKNIMQPLSNNYCEVCDTTGSLYLRNERYGKISLNNFETSMLNGKNNFNSIVCNKCNKEYKINWIEGIPYPLFDEYSINYFLQKR